MPKMHHAHKFKFRFATALIAVSMLLGCGKSSKDAPVIRLIGFDTVYVGVGDVFVDPGAIAFDRQDLDISEHITTTGPVSTSEIGHQELLYSVTDDAGNVGTAKRYVKVAQSVASLSGQYQSSNNCSGCGGTGIATISAYDRQLYPNTLLIRPANGSASSSSLILDLDLSGRLSFPGLSSVVCLAGIRNATGEINEAGDSIRLDLQMSNWTFCSALYTR